MSTDTLDLSDFGSEEDLKGYDYPKDGQYHLAVNTVDATREKVNGIKVELQVLAGNVKGQAGKTFWETFWDPSAESKDGGRFARKRQASFALAIGLITPAEIGKGGVAIDWEDARGRQFVAGITNYERKGDDGKTYKGAQIDGLNIFRVTAPEVKEVPKDEEALALIITGATSVASEQQAPTQSQSEANSVVSDDNDWDTL